MPKKASPPLEAYIRNRAKVLRLSLSEVCRRAGIQRQTLYSLSSIPNRLPSIETLMALAHAIGEHPMYLLNLVFDARFASAASSGDKNPQTDHSGFVRDVTYPDGTMVLPKQKFIKTWEVQNMGKVPWENRFLQCMDDDLLVYSRQGERMIIAKPLVPSTSLVPVPYTEPGELAQISVEFTAPALPCTVLSYWKSIFADGTLCFPKASGLWVKVRVSSLANKASEANEARTLL